MTCYGLGTLISNELAHHFCMLTKPEEASFLLTRFVVDSDGGGSAHGTNFDEGLANFVETLDHSRSFWIDRIARHWNNDRSFLINNSFYLHSNANNGIRGFGGALNYIVLNTPDMRVIKSNNLWHQGYAPEAVRRANKLTDNASFLDSNIQASMWNLTKEGIQVLKCMFEDPNSYTTLEELKANLLAHQRTPTP
jgi:hypothetical protein